MHLRKLRNVWKSLYAPSMEMKGGMQSVNDLAKKMLLQKFDSVKKLTSLTLLPPCHANLKHHIKRSNDMASILRHAGCLTMNLDDPANHGWDERDQLFVMMYATRMMLQSCFSATNL